MTFGYLNKALEKFNEVINVYKIEEKNEQISFAYKGLAEVYQKKGNYKESLRYFKKALKNRKRFLSNDNHFIAQSYNDLAFIYSVKEYNKQKALILYLEAKRRYEINLGENHIDTASVYNNIGEEYRYFGKYDTAFFFISKAISIREKELGFESIDVAISYNTLGVYYSNINKYDKSIYYLNKALNILELKLGPDHEYVIQSKYNIKYIYSLINN